MCLVVWRKPESRCHASVGADRKGIIGIRSLIRCGKRVVLRPFVTAVGTVKAQTQAAEEPRSQRYRRRPFKMHAYTSKQHVVELLASRRVMCSITYRCPASSLGIAVSCPSPCQEKKKSQSTKRRCIVRAGHNATPTASNDTTIGNDASIDPKVLDAIKNDKIDTGTCFLLTNMAGVCVGGWYDYA